MKKTDDTIQREGKTWYWCPHHRLDGTYYGLYVTHKPEEHEEWKRNKSEFRRNKYSKEKNNVDPDGASDDNTKKKLTIKDNLKAALLTHCELTGAQIDEILQDAKLQSDF